jgi:tRNA modification GTPase
MPAPRSATYCPILGQDNEILDYGIVLFFPGPHSFTGEDVLELQGHGGPVVLDRVLKRVLSLGARVARPGEFSERAFFNGKLDLAQAEAIADLIGSASESAARLATRTLQGDFSRRVRGLVDRVTALRAYIEAAIDFPDEDIELLSNSYVTEELEEIGSSLERIRTSARQGQLLRDGMTLVIAGPPNAGKSSLMNALAGREAAIVTHIPGTTRDVLRERILIDGMPVHIIDTAGLREIDDIVEREGIRRARYEIEHADRILWVFDAQEDPHHDAFDRATLPEQVPITLVRNKIDLTGSMPGIRETQSGIEVSIAADSGQGINDLRSHLKACVGYEGPHEGEFMARRRHLAALERAESHLNEGRSVLISRSAGELLAEELRLVQIALSEITGEFLPEDLLGEIFGRFCIGK